MRYSAQVGILVVEADDVANRQHVVLLHVVHPRAAPRRTVHRIPATTQWVAVVGPIAVAAVALLQRYCSESKGSIGSQLSSRAVSISVLQ
jgi:hypothetical protein